MSEEISQTVDQRLGQEFWTQPSNTLSEPMQLIYRNLVSVLREEIASLSNGGAVDFMVAERVAWMYSFMRERESQTGQGKGMSSLNDRNRREMNKDLIDLLLTIKKLWAADAKDDMAERVLTKVNKAIFSVIKDLPESDGRKLQSELADAFEANGL